MAWVNKGGTTRSLHLVPFGMGCFLFGKGGVGIAQRRWAALLLVLLMLTLAGCAPTTRSQAPLGPEATVLTRTAVSGGEALLGSLPSGEWVLGAALKGKPAATQTVQLDQRRPTALVLNGIALVAGLAPDPAAQRVELLNERQELLKAQVVKGAYLVAWPTAEPVPKYIIRVLDAKGKELFRWPVGTIPAA